MDLRAGRKPHVSVPSPPAGRTRRPQPAAPGSRGKPDRKVASQRSPICCSHSPGAASLLPRGQSGCPEAGKRGRLAAPPTARSAPPAAPRPLPRPRPPSKWPRRCGRAPCALSASPSPTRPSPRVPAAAGLAHEDTRTLREAATGTEEDARRPLAGVTLAPRSLLPRINKIFKMAVREGKRECGGQSGPRAGSWRARSGGGGVGRRLCGKPWRAGPRRGREGRPGRGQRGRALPGRPGGVRRQVGVLPGKRRFPGGGRERARDRRGGAERKNARGPACVLSPWLVPGKEKRPRVREGAVGGW